MCLAGSKERLAGHVYRAMVAAYEGDRFEDGNLLENVEKMRKKLETLEQALTEVLTELNEEVPSNVVIESIVLHALKEINSV